MIDLDKPVQTRDGREAKVHTVDGKDDLYPVVGEVKKHSGWEVERWTMAGALSVSGESLLDLVNVPQKHTKWILISQAYNGVLWGQLYASEPETHCKPESPRRRS